MQAAASTTIKSLGWRECHIYLWPPASLLSNSSETFFGARADHHHRTGARRRLPRFGRRVSAPAGEPASQYRGRERKGSNPVPPRASHQRSTCDCGVRRSADRRFARASDHFGAAVDEHALDAATGTSGSAKQGRPKAINRGFGACRRRSIICGCRRSTSAKAD